MGAGADAEIVAEMPVIQVVPTLLARLCEGRSFVIVETGGGEPCLDGFLHVGTQVALGELRREGGKTGVRFERQLVAGKVRRGKR